MTHSLRSSPVTWRVFALRVALPFAVTRGILLVTGFLALHQLKVTREMKVWEIGPAGQVQYVQLSHPPTELSDGHWMVDMFSRWDAEWYLNMAKSGYHYRSGRGKDSNTAFFPLYPLLMSGVARLIGEADVSLLSAGMLVSNAALLIGLAYLFALIRLDFDEDTASRSIIYLLVFPTSFFFSAVYTESLFLLTVVAAFYHARHDQWCLAGMAGAAAALTRPPGVLMCAALGMEYLHQRNFRLKEVRADVLALGLIPLALVLHFTYLYWKFGNFFLFLETEKEWGRPLGGAEGKLPFFGHFAGGDLVITILVLVLLISVWHRLRPSYGVFATLAYLMPLASGTLLGMGRFSAVIFPVYIILALQGRQPAFDRCWLIISSSLGVLYMALFAQWHYVG
jgi:hypothetical protein